MPTGDNLTIKAAQHRLEKVKRKDRCDLHVRSAKRGCCFATYKNVSIDWISLSHNAYEDDLPQTCSTVEKNRVRVKFVTKGGELFLMLGKDQAFLSLWLSSPNVESALQWLKFHSPLMGNFSSRGWKNQHASQQFEICQWFFCKDQGRNFSYKILRITQ